MKVTKKDIAFAKEVAKDRGVTLTDEKARKAVEDVLKNDDRRNSDYEDFYYSLKNYFPLRVEE